MLIGEVARLANLSKDGVRYYEELGLITSSARSAGSRIYRDYDASVVDRIENIRGMQQLGFALKEIGQFIEAHETQAPIPKSTMVDFLEDRQRLIRMRIEELRGVDDFIEKKLEIYRAGGIPECAQGKLLDDGKLLPGRITAVSEAPFELKAAGA